MVEAARPEHLPAILRLNQAHQTQTSVLDASDLGRMVATSFCTLVVDSGAGAALIAFDQDAPYASPNFAWFRARLPRFVYIDRVIVAPAMRRQGWARKLYDAVIAAMPAARQSVLCCEVNVAPPNPGSDAFHAALGFIEAGRSEPARGGKSVRYFTRTAP